MSWLFKDPVVIMKEIISWLCKDPINCGLAQFDHAQSNCPKWFFSRKTPYRISMYLLAPFILQNFLKNLRADPELWGCAIFWMQNEPFVLSKIFLVQASITFIYLSALFIVQNLKEFLHQIQSYEGVPFLGPKWSISLNDNFLENLLMNLVSFIHAYLHAQVRY